MAKKSSKDNEKNLKTAAKTAKKVAPSKSQVKKAAKKSGLYRAVPYIMIILSLLLGLFFIFGKDSGIIGVALQKFCIGLLGASAYFLPLALMFLGVIWCILHFKEASPAKRDEDSSSDLRKLRRRTVSKTILVFLFLVLFSTFLGSIDDPSKFSIKDFWNDAIDDIWVGGVIGSTLGWALNYLMKPVITIILLVIVLLIVLCFVIGLTPDYIFNKIRCRREARTADLDIDEDKEAERYEIMRQKEIERHKKKVLRERRAQQRQAIRDELEAYDAAEEEDESSEDEESEE